ncbi:cytochrome P450 [Actinocorallia longicatena]|uniref:Cytochrome P450 n=1 Tax=Actinocorallia longicatena TaxID=111803 RepID=A0ABP6Q5M0_9ACTN
MQAPVVYPSKREGPLEPPAEFAVLRQGPPVWMVVPGRKPCWLVTRFEDARALLGDRRISSDDTRADYPQMAAVPPGLLSFLRMDDPRHGTIRRLLTPEFTVRRISALRTAIEDAADGLLDELAAGPRPVDLIAHYALPLPSLVICRLLGVPFEDHEFFQSRSAAIMSYDDPPEVGGRAMLELGDYLGRLIDAKTREPSDDMLGRVIAKAGADVSREDLVGIARLLIVAGHETTANMLGVSVLALLQHPDQLAALRADPTIIQNAVEELLRHQTIVQAAVARTATEDIDVGGVTIAAGDGVIVAVQSANRDETVAEDPDRLDLTRPPTRHLAFGHGAHQCLGQALARLELDIGLTRLFSRLPSLALAASHLPQARETAAVYGLHDLQVTW